MLRISKFSLFIKVTPYYIYLINKTKHLILSLLILMASKFNNSKYSYQEFNIPTNLHNIESGINEINKIL